MLAVPELPFPVAPSHPWVWRCDEEDGSVVAGAPAHTDFYINPAGAGWVDAETLLNAATLIGTPPEGDFKFSARVTVGFRAQFDAGVLLVWVDERNWAKFCFEFSPAQEPMVVSVVTRGVSDDANAFVVAERSIWLRISRLDNIYAFHAATDATTWQLIRVFTLGDGVHDHKIGFEAESPVGEGCTVSFTETCFLRQRLADLRDGS